jgi:hypothetical protein
MYAQLLTAVCIVQELGCRGTLAKRVRHRGSRRCVLCVVAASCSRSSDSALAPIPLYTPLPPPKDSHRRKTKQAMQENPSLSFSRGRLQIGHVGAIECAVDGILDALEKEQMQSAVDTLTGKVDLNLRDCNLLVKTGVLSDGTSDGPSPPQKTDVWELLARL